MQFFALSALTMAAVATAMPAASSLVAAPEATEAPVSLPGHEVIRISLPAGCTKGDLAKCAFHLIGTTASCGAAVVEVGANPAADLACIGSAAGTAASIDDCKNCIPK